jgi:hypothetical protein
VPKSRQPSLSRSPSAIKAFLTFVEEHAEQELSQTDADRMFDLDFAAGAECKKLGIEVRKSSATPRTTYMNLPYHEKSIYEFSGALDWGGGENLPKDWPLIMNPDGEWLNWLRAVVRGLGDAKPAKSLTCRASIAAKIELLKHELKQHLISARDYAYVKQEETGAPELLPRPLKKELAKRLKIKPYDVTRCLRNPHGAEVKALWDIAADLDRIMSFSSR